MRLRVLRELLVIGGLSVSATALAAPSASMLSGTCAACHGPNGNSVAVTPSLAGTDKAYFVETMKAFKSGARKATVMDRVAKGYSDAEIEAMAGYFASQKPVAMKQTFDTAKAKLGKDLHKDYCEKCHEDGGRNPQDSALLAGQSMLYLGYAMEDFHNGNREMPKKMKTKVEEMSKSHGKAGGEALLHYYGSQQ